MIVRIQTGRSFHGAALYYLHDKRGMHELLRLSDERVAWTETHNTASNIPELAIQEMIAVAEFQTELKRESGQSLGGRPLEDPVMTIALSWHPTEKPAKEHMRDTAKDFLAHMGWEDHQALLLAHNDTQHQHVHIVLNRIHPRTGLVHDDSNSFHRSERWRKAYDRDHDRARTPTHRGHMPHDIAISTRDGAARYAQLEALASKSVERQERDQLARRHQKEREAFLESRHQQFREARQTAYRETRAEYRPQWIEHFAKAEHAREQAKALHRDTAARALHFAGKADFPAAWQAVSERDSTSRDIRIQLYKERQELRARQREETRERQDAACQQLYAQRAAEFTAIKQRQKEERAELKELQTARDGGQPFGQHRLAELLADTPAPDRTTSAHEQGRGGDDSPIIIPTPQREAEPRDRDHHDPAPKAPKRDGFDGLAGGIGKLAEIASDILGSLIAPPSPKEQAVAKAQAEAEAEAAPEREANQQAAEAQQRAQSTAEQIQAYFAEHADRIRNEEHERALKKRRDKER